jgi:hypothetical protein
MRGEIIMNHPRIAQLTSLAALALFAPIGASAGTAASELAPVEKVDACVAAITARADYSEASRVRHEVLSKKRRRLGHKLVIDTTVFGKPNGKVIRKYAAICYVSYGDTPIRIEITD